MNNFKKKSKYSEKQIEQVMNDLLSESRQTLDTFVGDKSMLRAQAIFTLQENGQPDRIYEKSSDQKLSTPIERYVSNKSKKYLEENLSQIEDFINKPKYGPERSPAIDRVAWNHVARNVFGPSFYESKKGEQSVNQMWENFTDGKGPETYEFDEGTIWVEDMKKAPTINAIRNELKDAWINNGEGRITTHVGWPVSNYQDKRRLNGVTLSPVRHFIGGYEVDAEIKGDEIHYKIDNTVSFKSYSSSYLSGEGDFYPRSVRKEMGNMPMTLKWKEKIKQDQ